MKTRTLSINKLITLALAIGITILTPDALAKGKPGQAKGGNGNDKRWEDNNNSRKNDKSRQPGNKQVVKKVYRSESPKQKHPKKAKPGRVNNKNCRAGCNKKVVVVERKVYKKVPVRNKRAVGEVVVSIPVGSITIVIRGQVFHHYDNVYYKRVGRGYQVVHAPQNAYRKALPLHAKKTGRGKKQDFFYDGWYYRFNGSGYLASQAPFSIS